MTGFGTAEAVCGAKKIIAEVKSLNSKQLDLNIRLPQAFRYIEQNLRTDVAQQLLRGKVDISINVETIEGSASSSINLPVVEKYRDQILEMSRTLGIPEPTDWYATLLRLPDAVKNELNATDVDDDQLDTATQVTLQAVAKAIDFRKHEGERLEHFFEEKIAAIQALLLEVPQYEQARLDKIRGRILENLNKLEGVTIDNNRLEQEMIFYIEKLDIAEEKLRLQNHLDYFLDTLHNGEGQGKKLGFISQEMGREINTLGSKANHAEMQNLVVRMKDHLEQIKEQVLNVL